jgi:hypothetical protein
MISKLHKELIIIFLHFPSFVENYADVAKYSWCYIITFCANKDNFIIYTFLKSFEFLQFRYCNFFIACFFFACCLLCSLSIKMLLTPSIICCRLLLLLLLMPTFVWVVLRNESFFFFFCCTSKGED